MARTKQKMSSKKKMAAITAVALAAIMLVGGAFAWHDFSQSAINRMRGITSPDVLLHDDFADEWIDGIREKDVYVENTGDVDTIVRIRFSEFLQIGNDKVIGTNSKDVKTWDVHTFNPGLPGHAASKAHEYFSWNMDGDQKVYLTDTSEMGYFEYNKGDYTWTEQHPITSTVDYTVQKGANGQPYGETLPAATVISMADYIADKATIDAGDGCWIVDVDGWCYWSKTLKPGEATNMLLSSVEMIKNPNDNYAYNIYVDLEACNATEINDLINSAKGMTKNAEDNLINGLAGLVVVDSATFPDPVFRDAILNGYTNHLGVETFAATDKNGDGKLSEAERNAVTKIDIRGESNANRGALTSLDGSENFQNVTSILATYNNIATLDVSKNTNLEKLYVGYNSLSVLDNLPSKLTVIDCRFNNISTIDLSGLSQLTELYAQDNNISSLDFSETPKIYLINGQNNIISEINLTDTPELLRMHFSNNSLDDADMSSLGLSGRAMLEVLDVSDNNFTSINVSNNKNLYELRVGGNSGISTLDVSLNTKLKMLTINNTAISTINLSTLSLLERFFAFNCSSLTSLDVSNNPALYQLHVYNSNIGTLDISKTVITLPVSSLRIENNGMTSLTVNAAQNTAGIGSHTSYHRAGNTLTVTVAP